MVPPMGQAPKPSSETPNPVVPNIRLGGELNLQDSFGSILFDMLYKRPGNRN